MSDQPFQPPISQKQAEILNSPFQFNLVTGPRFATKSIGCLHDIPWHMWNTPGAIGMMLGKTTTQNSDAGLWSILHQTVLPQWVDGGFGFEIVTPERMEAVTHKLYFETTNKFGGVSRYYLDSLDVETEAERKFKGKIFSHIYGTEFSHFRLRKTFDVLQECFRVPGLRDDQHKMVLDTNPSDEGTDSWMWKLFYWFRTVDLDDMTPELMEELNLANLPADKLKPTITSLKRLQSQLNVLEFSVDDNVFVTQERRDAQFAKYAHDKDLLDRYYYGKWVKASGDGIFREVWRPEIHVEGDPKTPSDPNPKMLIPEEGCVELCSGADIGRRNTALVFAEPFQMECIERDRNGKEYPVIKTAFKILDEYVSLGKQQRLSDIANIYLDKIDFWNSFCPRLPIWKHISDSSAFAENLDESDEAKEIYRYTSGVVELESVISRYRVGIKGHGAVEKSIGQVQRMLLEGRLIVNRSRCPNVIEMFSSIARNKQGKLSPTNIQKHVLDALRYLVAVKCWEEMVREPRIRTSEEGSGIIVTSL